MTNLRRVVLLIAAVALCVAFTGCERKPPGEPVVFALGFAEGEKDEINVGYNMEVQIEVPAALTGGQKSREPMKMTAQGSLKLQTNTTEVTDDGTGTLSLLLTSLNGTAGVTMPDMSEEFNPSVRYTLTPEQILLTETSGEVLFDSTAEENLEAEFSYQKAVAEPFLITISPNGMIRGIQLPPYLQELLAAQTGGFDLDVMWEDVPQFTLPAEEKAPGDSWEVEIPMPEEAGAIDSMPVSFKFEGYESCRGNECARLVITSTQSMKDFNANAASGMAMPFPFTYSNVKIGQTWTMFYDPEKRMFPETEIGIKMDSSMTMGMSRIKMHMNGTISISIREMEE